MSIQWSTVKTHRVNRIAYYRKKRDLTQSELASLVGVSCNAICSYEHYEYLPKLAVVFRLCDVLRVPINDLFPMEVVK